MRKVGLQHLSRHLNESSPWSCVFSGGEQARLSFAGILLNQPDPICLDESTSHLDDTTTLILIRLIQRELPRGIIIVVSHQRTVMDSLHMQYHIE
ncbi:hypothetical protein INS55_12040 [Raoultella terrigena]|nr:hypothetical protein [Raoultella terrigena]